MGKKHRNWGDFDMNNQKEEQYLEEFKSKTAVLKKELAETVEELNAYTVRFSKLDKTSHNYRAELEVAQRVLIEVEAKKDNLAACLEEAYATYKNNVASLYEGTAENSTIQNK